MRMASLPRKSMTLTEIVHRLERQGALVVRRHRFLILLPGGRLWVLPSRCCGAESARA
jgi:hypothetical protein